MYVCMLSVSLHKCVFVYIYYHKLYLIYLFRTLDTHDSVMFYMIYMDGITANEVVKCSCEIYKPNKR